MKTLMLKDLSASTELDGEAMSAVRGGFLSSSQGNVAGGALAMGSSGGIGNVTLAVNVPTQLNVNLPSFVNTPVAVAVAGTAVA